MDFPIADLMDEHACKDRLVDWSHPTDSPARAADRMVVHRGRDLVLDYCCGHRKRVFNAFTGTVLRGTELRPGELAMILLRFAQGVPTAQPARDCAAIAPGR